MSSPPARQARERGDFAVTAGPRAVYERMRNAGEAVITATFEESHGRTRLTLHELFPSKEALEGALASTCRALPPAQCPVSGGTADQICSL